MQCHTKTYLIKIPINSCYKLKRHIICSKKGRYRKLAMSRRGSINTLRTTITRFSTLNPKKLRSSIIKQSIRMSPKESGLVIRGNPSRGTRIHRDRFVYISVSFFALRFLWECERDGGRTSNGTYQSLFIIGPMRYRSNNRTANVSFGLLLVTR